MDLSSGTRCNLALKAGIQLVDFNAVDVLQFDVAQCRQNVHP